MISSIFIQNLVDLSTSLIYVDFPPQQGWIIDQEKVVPL